MSISEGSGVFAVIAATATIAYLGYRFGNGKAKHVQQKLPPGTQPTAVITGACAKFGTPKSTHPHYTCVALFFFNFFFRAPNQSQIFVVKVFLWCSRA
jgi:hypothetical protein